RCVPTSNAFADSIITPLSLTSYVTASAVPASEWISRGSQIRYRSLARCSTDSNRTAPRRFRQANDQPATVGDLSVDLDRPALDAVHARGSGEQVGASQEDLAGAGERDAGLAAAEDDLLAGREDEALAVALHVGLRRRGARRRGAVHQPHH